jgi:hypothetical protein
MKREREKGNLTVSDDKTDGTSDSIVKSHCLPGNISSDERKNKRSRLFDRYVDRISSEGATNKPIEQLITFLPRPPEKKMRNDIESDLQNQTGSCACCSAGFAVQLVRKKAYQFDQVQCNSCRVTLATEKVRYKDFSFTFGSSNQSIRYFELSKRDPGSKRPFHTFCFDPRSQSQMFACRGTLTSSLIVIRVVGRRSLVSCR